MMRCLLIGKLISVASSSDAIAVTTFIGPILVLGSLLPYGFALHTRLVEFMQLIMLVVVISIYFLTHLATLGASHLVFRKALTVSGPRVSCRVVDFPFHLVCP
jgi:hypothetical protein